MNDGYLSCTVFGALDTMQVVEGKSGEDDIREMTIAQKSRRKFGDMLLGDSLLKGWFKRPKAVDTLSFNLSSGKVRLFT
jgi:hypothetical protein